MSDFNLEDLKQKFGFSGKPLQWQHGFLGMFNQAEQHIHGLNQQNKQLQAEVERLKKDEMRIDWLGDKNQNIGNVMLPTVCVEQNLHSLRGAIDMAMQLEPSK